MSVCVGILALQGAVEPHRPHLEALGCDLREIRAPVALDGCDALILPGGESSTMLRLIDLFGLREPLSTFMDQRPVWGVCAGCILLAREVRHPGQWSFGKLDITAERNAYGSQVESHEAEVEGFPVAFIRAPIIRRTGPGVTCLALHRGTPSWVCEGRLMATTFHPELARTYPSPMHRALRTLCA